MNPKLRRFILAGSISAAASVACVVIYSDFTLLILYLINFAGIPFSLFYYHTIWQPIDLPYPATAESSFLVIPFGSLFWGYFSSSL